MHPQRLLACFLLALAATLAHAQVPVVMLSDIHFDPFHDPAKLPQLRSEPIARWPVILNSAASPTQAADLEHLQTTCHGRALDTAWPLLGNTLAAAHAAEPRPLFVTVAGDLLTHEFACRYTTLTPGATPQDISRFAAKTIQFVDGQLQLTFPHAPAYTALGNNDSGCADYRETPGSLFIGEALRGMVGGAAQTSMNDETFSKNLAVSPEGDYSVALSAPMTHTRLIVLQDTFQSRQFTTCAGTPDRAPEQAQIDWLRTQLAAARAHGEHVWVMAHIPPGIDVYTSFRRYLLQPAEMCNATPTAFLADTAFADALLDYADIVRLALFGHTHMDEFRILSRNASAAGSVLSSQGVIPSGAERSRGTPVFANASATGTSLSSRPEVARSAAAVERPAGEVARAEGTSLSSTTAAAIPAKLTPSVTPYLGNHPAFLVATVDPHTAILKDWRTFVSPGAQGSTPPWTEAYRFTAAFGLPDFSAASALKLAASFTVDKSGQNPQSSTFRQHFYPGDIGLYALGLAQIWPAYACSIREDRPSAVRNCICAALPAPKSEDTQP